MKILELEDFDKILENTMERYIKNKQLALQEQRSSSGRLTRDDGNYDVEIQKTISWSWNQTLPAEESFLLRRLVLLGTCS